VHEANQVADSLVKHGMKLMGQFHVFEVVTDFICNTCKSSLY